MDSKNLSVALVLRKPRNGFYSIERVFDSISPSFRPNVTPFIAMLPAANAKPWSIIRNLLYTWNLKADIVHITGETYYCALAVRRARVVITYHDLVSLRRTAGIRRRLLKTLYYSLPVRRADAITAISGHTRDELVALCPRARGKISIVHNPIKPEFYASGRPMRTGLSPRILFVGTAKHKNLSRCVEALRGLDVHLQIVGSPTDEQYDLLSKSGVLFSSHPNLSDLQLRDAYLEADLLLFASEYEGFGLPILEAQALGVPVVTSSVSSMPEVAGDGALFVDPKSPASIREAVVEVLGSAELRTSLIERGRINLGRFNSSKIAEEYESVYRALTRLT
jgi:glycosyltransferase involved in cell wall biosynthesis